MKAMLATIAIVSGLTFDAAAEPAPATPENEHTVQEAVVAMFSPIGVTPDMIERVEFCRYRIDRPALGYQRIFDFTILDNVFAFVGLTGDHSTASKADIIISGRNPSGFGRDFTCIVDGGGSQPRDCESEFTIGKANVPDFSTVHGVAADIVRLCNPGASYKACQGGQYGGFACAD